jgi:sulfatase maturation enzyme AslB (radical SAM superfamily)
MTTSLPLARPADSEPAGAAPVAPFVRLTTLWIQVTGTWCNLTCTHCINASGPNDPWLAPMDSASVRRAVTEAETLGVKELYFTGGEPFLHPAIVELLAFALEVAPSSVLTNGTRIDAPMAKVLARLAEAAPYSLEIRVSLDDVDEERNDRIRGRGAWKRAVRAIRLLAERGLLPIVTATEILRGTDGVDATGMHQRFRDFLLSLGIEKPRVKIMPVFAAGRLAGCSTSRLAPADLDGFDCSVLQCAEARVVATGGVYACPILAGLPGAKLSDGSLPESFRPASLYHPACITCYQTGMSCRNY